MHENYHSSQQKYSTGANDKQSLQYFQINLQDEFSELLEDIRIIISCTRNKKKILQESEGIFYNNTPPFWTIIRFSILINIYWFHCSMHLYLTWNEDAIFTFNSEFKLDPKYSDVCIYSLGSYISLLSFSWEKCWNGKNVRFFFQHQLLSFVLYIKSGNFSKSNDR